MPQPNDLSRSLVALDHNSTIIAVVELSQSSWLVGGGLPGIERQPRKKLEPSPERLLALLHRWRDEAIKAGRNITRIALAFEAGRDGFWLARWLAARGVEAHVIHPSSVAVSREHRRAKTDRLDTELLKRGFLGCGALRRPDGRAGRERRQAAAKAGNARVRRGMIPLAWRFLRFQKDSALARWYQAPHCRSPCRHTQNDDRRTRAQTAHRTLALCHHWADAGGRRLTAGAGRHRSGVLPTGGLGPICARGVTSRGPSSRAHARGSLFP